METRHHNRIHLAQNFLRSPKLVRRLVSMSTIGPSDTVYEIGPGNGIITAVLASVAKKVIAVEKDPRLVCRLRERFRAFHNIEIVEQDWLASALQRNQSAPYKIFANIPYNITARILRGIVYGQPGLAEAYLVLQREAAKKYSGVPAETLCSILAKPFFEFQIVVQLRRTDFSPVPNVDSVLLRIKRRYRPLVDDVAAYREFVEYGFGRWKPNLRLAFKKVFTYRQWKRLTRELDIPFNATPTQLTFKHWLGLYKGFRHPGA
jgi:16S rRNA A1518/A1519 N6-dimethyltransferase RsmA/KsgA/DIM1 with predicted DNA glycosylase/AP lyase activity